MKEGNEHTPQCSEVIKRRRKRKGGTKFSSSKAKRYRDALKRTGDACESPLKLKRYIELQDDGPPSCKQISIRKLILEPVLEERETNFESDTMVQNVRMSGNKSSIDGGASRAVQPQISTFTESGETFDSDEHDSDSQVQCNFRLSCMMQFQTLKYDAI